MKVLRLTILLVFLMITGGCVSTAYKIELPPIPVRPKLVPQDTPW